MLVSTTKDVFSYQDLAVCSINNAHYSSPPAFCKQRPAEAAVIVLRRAVNGNRIPVIDRPTFTSLQTSVSGKIVLEEHINTAVFNVSYTTPYFPLTDEIPYTAKSYQGTTGSRLDGSASSIAARIEEMDKANISISILSLTGPGIQGIFNTTYAIYAASAVNNETAAIYKTGIHSSRFEFFCQVPLQDAEAAAAEAERCVKDLGGVGIWSNGYTNNNSANAPIYLDHPMYEVFWAKVQELNVPLYLHPREPIPQQQTSFVGYEFLAGSVLGFSTETMTHALRIMLSGVFDRYPDIKIILGHCGEGLPFYLTRMKQRMRHMTPGSWAMKSDLLTYWEKNFWVTTSGVMSLTTLNAAIGSIGANRVLFSVDYPFEDDVEQAGWFDGLELPGNTKDMIGFENAKTLFGFT
ncbi:hypothetical protein DSL72_000556 [Monilinia vaccinii-corymbosi]|uniref:Amidohydrolase-related domain-containing protein n=1 Tax=Monilinia vaccinii-corymbosi TaxID=61207 RepID=A0A8A3NZA5_9HELO|nr:hypothetical protein DSL72_000556 [Monilinia vaccinii-corymbosi]